MNITVQRADLARVLGAVTRYVDVAECNRRYQQEMWLQEGRAAA